MLVRTLTPADGAAFLALRREMLADSPWSFASSPEDDVAMSPGFMEVKLLEPGQAIVGAFEDEGTRLVASAGLFRDRHLKMAHRARVWGVYVTPGSRGRGVAAAVVERAVEVARSWPGVNSVGLSVSARAVGARRVYERLGFRAWGVEPAVVRIDGEECDEVHMVRFLDGRA